MPPDAEPRSKHAPADQEYLDSLSTRQLMDFRNYVRRRRGVKELFLRTKQLFSPTYIALNAARFLDHEWVDIGELRKYLQHTTTNSGFDASTTRLSTIPAPVHIKIESTPLSVVKLEPQAST